MTAKGGDHIIRAALRWPWMWFLVPRLDVAELARKGRRWRGTIDVAAFERLGPVLFGAALPNPGHQATPWRQGIETGTPSVSAALEFSLDVEGRPRVRGRCRVVAPVFCTRCAENVDIAVVSDLDFRVVATDAEAQSMTPTFDAVVCEDNHVPLTVLVEDDILLSIPERCCADPAACDRASEVELAGHGAETATKPLVGLGALVEGHQPV